MQRARSDEAKTARLQSILMAASALFSEFGPHMTLAQVASHAGLSRTTLYGYANTKEELLLLLVGADLERFQATVTNSLRDGAGPAVSVASAVTGVPTFAALLSLAGSVLESNVSYDAAMAWKQQVHRCVLNLGTAIDETTNAAAGSGARFLLHAYASVTGLYSVANPVSIAAKAIDDAGLTILRIEFRGELLISLTALEHALLAPPSQFTPKSSATRKLSQKATPQKATPQKAPHRKAHS
jgi:AcrR family transcriptional regulator